RRADDRQCAESHPRRAPARGVHGVLRHTQSRRHPRTGQVLKPDATQSRRKRLKQRGIHEPGPTAASGEARDMQPRSRAGRRLFQTRQLGGELPQALPGQGADNGILAQTLALQNEHPDARVILVSKDINLRIKAAVLGVHAEDYYSDKTLEDADVLYSGMS